MECKKCESPASVLLRKKDAYCESCFMSSTQHKFRSCLGKHRAISAEDKILVAISEGINSSILLDLVYSSTKLDNHKKLLVIPFIVHIIGLSSNIEQELEIVKALINKCNNIGFDLYILHISEYFNSKVENLIPNTLPLVLENNLSLFNAKCKNLSRTEYNEYMQTIRRNLLIKAANCLNCKIVFMGETTATLATNLLSNVAMGRGSQIEHDIGFMDYKNNTVKILRPLKDITAEEVTIYCKIKQLTSLGTTTKNETSIQCLLKNFVKELDGNFPATVSTICKTADKIGSAKYNLETIQDKCLFCESALLAHSEKLTALEATKFSKMMCVGKSRSESPISTLASNDTLCFSCSKFSG